MGRIGGWMWRYRLGLFAVIALLLFLPAVLSRSSARRQGDSSFAAPQQAPDWARVERLISEQKFAEAAAEAEKLRQAAQQAGNRDEWTRALIKEVQLRTGLHGYETAVRFLKEQPWPDGQLNRAALNLFYARALVNYYNEYSWEINQREKIDTRGVVDLKAWTKDQIFAEALKAYQAVWAQRTELGAEPVSRFADFLNRNNYPDGVRSTLRDAISYLFVEMLADTSLWTPQESNEMYRLDLKALLAGPQPETVLTDPAIHPLVQICYLLSDLEQWHVQNRRREAALEARLTRIERLHSSFFDEESARASIVADLGNLLAGYRDVPWWSKGKATQAEFWQVSSQTGNRARARAIAEEGYKAYPESLGGKRCYHILKLIEAPRFQVASMSADGPQKRSIEVTHANLPTLYFRAHSFDIENRLVTARDYNLLPNPQEQESLLAMRPFVAEWSVGLPATPDYESHRTFVTPPMKNLGAYMIAASARKDFLKGDGNQITSFIMILSDLVILSQPNNEGLQVQAMSGQTGNPLPGATVSLYRYDWQQGHRKVDERVSDPEGRVYLPYSQDRQNTSFFLFARQGANLALNPGYFSSFRNVEPTDIRASLIYTDRSVYRPLQKVLWKVVAYGGSNDQARYNTLPSTPVEMSLIDPNGQKVDTRIVMTNGFGSAAGEFAIPAGRLMGNWRVRSSLNAEARVKVEEYKRPTFEVTFKDPESPLRLNRPATFTGDVKYYFGLPVTSGAVSWRAIREPVYPMWWGWYGERSASSGGQTVAAGTAALDTDGRFAIHFTPEADERKAAESRDITYRYRVSVDVTDEGGETRSASKIFRLGFVSVEANFDGSAGFFREGIQAQVSVFRTDLNGTPRAGSGTWRLVTLQQPARTLLPADLPVQSPYSSARGKNAGEESRTPGDSLRPRWDRNYNFRAVLRTWADGTERGRGNLSHDGVSDASIALPTLPAGAYRLYYNTADDFGSAYETSWEFIVAGQNTSLALPAVLIPENNSEPVGNRARFLALSGLSDQPYFFEVWRGSRLAERRKLVSGKDASLIEIPIEEQDRGGLTVRLIALRDHQLMNFDTHVSVPFDNKQLKVEFSTFRDRLRPGAIETWRVTVKDPAGASVEAGAAELLTYMYDRSLDIFAPHNPPSPLSLYWRRTYPAGLQNNLGETHGLIISGSLFTPPPNPVLVADVLKFYDNYGIGGPGRVGFGRGGGIVGGVAGGMARNSSSLAVPAAMSRLEISADAKSKTIDGIQTEAAPEEPAPLRSDFSETAFWQPQFLTGADGAAIIEFTVPDSVTSWNVWVHAVTRDLKSGSIHKEAQSFKELMVRPYLPRFLREGDRAELKVVVNNASERELQGRVTLDIIDPETDQSLLSSFGLNPGAAQQPFTVAAGQGTNLTFPITAPVKVGLVAFKVTAAAGDTSDGELRPLPLLPGRMHLAESRFVTLKNQDRREMIFDRLRNPDDPTLVNEQLVVTLDAQLFYSVLSALPYLVNYPYECTEQTLNRFVSTGILSSLYGKYPAVARMAAEFAKRDTPLETWDAADPNRKMALEETPWLTEARGGTDAGLGTVNVLDPRIARADQEGALARLRKAQTANGAFPWWPGGPPSPYMTLYIMYGLAKASEFGVEVPKDMVQRGWAYLAQHFREEYATKMIKEDCCWEFLTFLNYVASCYTDASWMGEALTQKERQDILNHCFRHWQQHSPYLKCELALTLKRMGRSADAALVFASVMDSARTTPDQGTFWAQEDRSWLWYNDTIETQAFALRTLMELEPADARRDGLVQWLFLNKKLNHWKSTRATAEVIYSLVHYLQKEGQLAVREDATVRVGGQTIQYVFEPDQYTGKKNQTVITGDKLNAGYATVEVAKESPGFAFASATWHFSTEKLPEQGSGDFLSVTRTYFKRESDGRETVLKPLAEGAEIRVGDQLEIHLSIRAQHPCEYVHLRDPRAAGLEPENPVSRFKWDLGIGWYEEVRDSGTNFFFEQLPQGEYTFKYRLRANLAGTFRVAPATLQSMYAPEFNAYSAGIILTVR